MSSLRWLVGRRDQWRSREVASPGKIEAFLDAYEKLCREHGFSLSHEDGHGAFEIEAFSQNDIEWVRGAHIGQTLDENGDEIK